MRDRQRWMSRLSWTSLFVGFHLLTILQCSYTHRKVPQRKSRQAALEAVEGIAGVWSSWGAWSSCSSSCGSGISHRSRRCLPQENEAQAWSGWEPARAAEADNRWESYPERAVSALRRTYPLHVESEAQLVPNGRHALPLYGESRATSQQGASLYTPANGEPLSRHLYGRPANRGSLPLYRTNGQSGHERQRGSANGETASPYGAWDSIGRDSGSSSRPQLTPNQSTAQQPRQRSAPNWRVSAGNRRSLNRQELHPTNRSQGRSVIRPGQYGYGRVPSNFQLNGAMAHLLQTTPGRHPMAKEGGSQQTASPEASPRRRWAARRVQRAPKAQAEDSVKGRSWQAAEGRMDGQASEAPVSRAPLTRPQKVRFAKALKLEEGDGPANSPSPEDPLSPVERGRGVRRQRDLWPLATDEMQPLKSTSYASRERNFTSAGGPVSISQAPDISGPDGRVWQEGMGGQSQTRPPTKRMQKLNPELDTAKAAQRKGVWRAGFPQAKVDTPHWPTYNESSGHGLQAQAKGAKERHRNRQDPGRRVSRPRRQNYGGPLDPGAEGHQDWNPHQWLTASCPGTNKQYKMCSLSPCLTGETDPRKVQCAHFNNLQFMGRYYKWEPFSEVRKEQRCELNCRPSGYRFYVRHADRVQDGTPCEANSTDVCVGGHCLMAGCDGILGSGTRPDRCGVCGGDGSSCELVFGLFEDSQVNVGYHQIIAVPAGATHINVTEAARSRNYLALRSHSGQSIINGNWAIDRPGQYEGAGTVFTYSRPSEGLGESIYASGPTTEPIEVYMIFQQDNPGIHYQFVLPGAKPAPLQPNPDPPSQTLRSQGTGGLRDVSALASHPAVSHRGSHRAIPTPPRVRGSQRDRRLQVYQTDAQEDPALGPPVYRWTSQSLTECSVSCGKGFQYPIYRCLSQDTQELVSEALCDSASKPATVAQSCNTQPCPAFWSVGAWSQCSKSCGRGIYHRQVLCRQAYANRTVAVHPRHCTHLEKPNTTQPCESRPCTHWQIQTDWESCSVPCGVGQRKRNIRCVSNQGNVVGEGECSAKQKPTDSEACDMGPCVTSWFYTDWSSKCSVDCGLGIQKRSVVCLNNDIGEHSVGSCEDPRPPDSRACTRPHCPRQVQWYASPWKQCPVQCGNATQNRDLICVVKVGNNFTVTAPSECAHLEKPPSVQPCNAGPCGSQWFTTDWSECSKSCMGGVQAREVRCLDDGGFPSSLCNEAQRPIDQRICHSHPCLPDLDENCKDKDYNCQVIVQARLCVYSYYKDVCCAACTHAERRASGSRGRHTPGRDRGT